MLDKCRVGEFLVDFERNQIIGPSNDMTTLEPKIMDLLRCLTEHEGEVVSQERIFQHVWKDTTFSPSTIQRGIALLRKAFAENAKTPSYIKTYPKRGYSLIAEVKSVDSSSPSKAASRKTHVWVSVMAFFAILVGSYFWFTQPDIKTEFHQRTILTKGESNEYEAQVHPQGEYRLFLRDKPDGTGNNIWLTRLSDSREFQLTDSKDDHHAGIVWSPDGQHIAFVKKNARSDIVGYISLDTISLSASIQTELHSFASRTVLGHRFQWSANNKLYLLNIPFPEETHLLRMDIATGTYTTLLKSSGKELIQNIALSPNQQVLAFTKSVNQNRYEVHLLDLNSDKTTKLTTLDNQIFGITWHPAGKHLLASNKSVLKLIDLTGNTEEISSINSNIIDATYSPDGQAILMQTVDMDVDILYSETPFAEQKVMIDSEAMDIIPIFSPDESQILYLSNRNGKQQIFVATLDGQSRLIFDNPESLELFGSEWSPDGREIVTATKDALHFIDLASGEVRSSPHGQQPFYIKGWYKHSPALLVSYYENKQFSPAKFNYETWQFEVLDRSVETQRCFYITLNESDHVLLSDGSRIFKLGDKATPEVIWQSERNHVNGFTHWQNHLFVVQNKTNNVDSVILTKVDLEQTSEQVFYQYDANDFKVVNASRDHSKLLMHSMPKMTRRVLRLE